MFSTNEILDILDDAYLAYKYLRDGCITGGTIKTNLDAMMNYILHLDVYEKEYPLLYPANATTKNFSLDPNKISSYFSPIVSTLNNVTNGFDSWLTQNDVRIHEYEKEMFKGNGITITPSNVFPHENQEMFRIKDTEIEVPTNINLTPGSSGSLADGTYYIQVTALNNVGETTPSTETSVTVSASGSGSINISWDAVTGATGYKIYISTTSGNEQLIGTASANSFTITDDNTQTETPPSVNFAHEILDGITIDTEDTGGAKVGYKVLSSDANDMEITINEVLEDGSPTSETITITGNTAAETIIELTNKVIDITGVSINKSTPGNESDSGVIITLPDRQITTH